MTTLTRLVDRLRSIADPATLIVSGVVFVASAVLLFASPLSFSLTTVEDACGQVAPDVRFYTSADDLHGFLAECGPEGREAYRNLQLADLAYPSIAALFPALALVVVFDTLHRRRPGSRDLSALALLPLLGAVFDYAENAVAWTALAAHPETSPVAPLFGVAAVGKQSANWLSWILLVIGLAALGALALRRRSVADRRVDAERTPTALVRPG